MLKKIGQLLELATMNDQDYFFRAVNEGNAYQVQRLLKEGKKVDLEARYSDGFTPLMAAVANGYIGVAEILLDRGAKVDARSNDGETALHCAVWNRNPGAVELLLAYGGRTTIKDNRGLTPQQGAALLGAEDIFSSLGTPPAESEPYVRLLLTAATGKLKELQDLLGKGVDPNVGASTGITALVAATFNSQEETAVLLLNSCAEVNTKTNKGRTPLMFAASRGNLRIVKILLSKGAGIGFKDVDGLSARDYAERAHHVEVVDFLDSALKEGDRAGRTGVTGT